MPKATFNIVEDICRVLDVNYKLLTSTYRASFDELVVFVVAYNILIKTKNKKEISKILKKDRTSLYHYDKLLRYQYKLFKYSIDKYEREKNF